MERMESFGLYVFPSHEEEAQHNNKQLLKENKNNPVAKIKATGKGTHINTGNSDIAGGLLSVIHLCKMQELS